MIDLAIDSKKVSEFNQIMNEKAPSLKQNKP
jgi:hypothetical protein